MRKFITAIASTATIFGGLTSVANAEDIENTTFDTSYTFETETHDPFYQTIEPYIVEESEEIVDSTEVIPEVEYEVSEAEDEYEVDEASLVTGSSDIVTEVVNTATNSSSGVLENSSKAVANVGASFDNYTTLIEDAINDQRIKHGLNPLEHSNLVAGSAQKWTSHMSNIGDFIHDTSSYFYNHMGEIIAQVSNPLDAIDLWMDSPGHRDAILWDTHNFMGIGIDEAPNGQYYVTVRFLD